MWINYHLNDFFFKIWLNLKLSSCQKLPAVTYHRPCLNAHQNGSLQPRQWDVCGDQRWSKSNRASGFKATQISPSCFFLDWEVHGDSRKKWNYRHNRKSVRLNSGQKTSSTMHRNRKGQSGLQIRLEFKFCSLSSLNSFGIVFKFKLQPMEAMTAISVWFNPARRSPIWKARLPWFRKAGSITTFLSWPKNLWFLRRSPIRSKTTRSTTC